MSNYAVEDLLLFGLGYVVDVTCLVELGLTTVVTLGSLEDLIDTHSFITAGVVILRAEWIG